MSDWLPYFYDGSFAGVSFWQIDDVARPNSAPRKVVLEHPSGNYTIITLGNNPSTLAIKVLVLDANVNDLQAAEQTSGTLNYRGGSISAFLDSVSGATRVVQQGVYEITLNFLTD